MSHDLLRGWLQLPASSWPPDHYTLLGLRPGVGGTDEIEQRVLERMDLLRRYQLLHPDQVTEGMNRLAQAMNCLLDPSARQAYDSRLGLVPPPLPVNLSAPPEEPPLLKPLETPPARATRVAEPRRSSTPTVVQERAETKPRPIEKVYSLGDEPPVVGPTSPIEKIYSLGDEPPGEIAPPIVLELMEEDDEPLRVDEFESNDEAFADSEPTGDDDPGAPQASNRPIYAELARIRAVLRIWKHLRTFLEDPEKAFQRRTEIVAFMAALSDLRPLLPGVSDLVGDPDRPGYLIATLARQALVAEMFRSLLPSQRESLAQDCRTGQYRLRERYDELRDELRELNRKGWARKTWHPLRKKLAQSPEFVLALLGCAALLVALLRSLPG